MDGVESGSGRVTVDEKGVEPRTRTKWEVLTAGNPSTIEEVIESLLKNRRVDRNFLDGALEDLEAHLAIRGMHEGAELMARHIRRGSKIVLVGDYDCDGITSLAQLSLFLREVNHKRFEALIPRREEGYGIPARVLSEHPDLDLLVALDCGTQETVSIGEVRSRGADCIVIDHHEVADMGTAPANVLINPKHPTCPSSFKEFATAGLTLIFLAQLRKTLANGGSPKPSLGGKYLALSAVGTVADLVPLVSGNRIIARHGLKSLNGRTFPPLNRIIEVAGLGNRTLTAGHLSFSIGPRINAAGRVADPLIAYDLLTARDDDKVRRLTAEVNRLNSIRQHQEEQILNEVRVRHSLMPSGRRTLVMADPSWPHGLVGIIASRIQQEMHYGPVVILSVDEARGTARGSARSVPGFDMHSALGQCSGHFIRWGGHKMAAGLTLEIDEIEAFTEDFEQLARTAPAEDFIPRGRIDVILDLGLVGSDLYEAMKLLEPHGPGNPLPVFGARNVRPTFVRAFGKDRDHFSVEIGRGLYGILWRGGRKAPPGRFNGVETMDLAFSLDWDHISGRTVLNIKDFGNLL